jgi:hypothetical protein
MESKVPDPAAGGRARAESLTPQERQEIAAYAAEKRWANQFPKETHTGVLKIKDKEIPCANLDNGLRVLSTSGVSRVVGSRKKGRKEQRSPQMPPFLASTVLKPYIPNDLLAPLISPIEYRPLAGGRALGYEATLLPRICEVILDAQKAGALTARHREIVETAELLIRGFARVGIIALVDEATGYQADRAKDELIKILEAYISKELLPWTKRFPDTFFSEIYRLHGWKFRQGEHKSRRPQVVGHLVRRLIYEQLPPGVLPELEAKNPVTESGYRKHRHHQLLTPDIGHPHLDKQVTSVIALMRASDSKAEFTRLFEKVFPKRGQQMRLPLVILPESPSE